MEHIQEDSHRSRHRTSSYCIAPHTAKAQSTWRVEERLRISVRPKSVHSPRQRLFIVPGPGRDVFPDGGVHHKAVQIGVAVSRPHP